MRQTIKEIGGTMPENLPTEESIKQIENREKKKIEKKAEVNMNIGEILIYQNSEGNIKLDVRLDEETVWLTQDQMASLFGKARTTLPNTYKTFLKRVN